MKKFALCHETLKAHSLSRKWSATTSAVVGVGPLAAVQHLREQGQSKGPCCCAHHERAPSPKPAVHHGLPHDLGLGKVQVHQPLRFLLLEHSPLGFQRMLGMVRSKYLPGGLHGCEGAAVSVNCS